MTAQFWLAALILILVIIFLYFLYSKKKVFEKKHFWLFFLVIISIIIFSKTLGYASSTTGLDLAVNSHISLLQTPVLTKIMIVLTTIFDNVYYIILAFILLLILIYKKRYYSSFLLVACSILGAASELIIKHFVARARPIGLIQESGFSFPSGHAIISIIFFSLLIYFFKDDIKNKISKSIFIAVCIFLILLIGFSRIYLQVHWFSDVIAGLSIGLFWVSFLILTTRIIHLQTQL